MKGTKVKGPIDAKGRLGKLEAREARLEKMDKEKEKDKEKDKNP